MVTAIISATILDVVTRAAASDLISITASTAAIVPILRGNLTGAVTALAKSPVEPRAGKRFQSRLFRRLKTLS